MKNIKKMICIFVILSIFCSAFCGISISADQKDFSLIGTSKFSNHFADGFGVAVYDNYAYVAGRAEGLQIFDITDKSAVNDITPDSDVLKGTTAIDAPNAVYVNDDFLYVCFTAASPQKKAQIGVRKYNLKDNPREPELICTYSASNAVSTIVVGKYTFVADKKYGVKMYKENNEKPYRVFKETGAENVSDFALAENFLYVSYTNGGVLVYSLHDLDNPMLVTKKHISSLTNAVRIVVNDNKICLADQGIKKLCIIDLHSVSEDLVYIDDADIYMTSLGKPKFEIRDMGVDDGYLYASDTSALYIIDISDAENIKWCKKVSTTLTNFKICDDFIIGTARTAGINIISKGEVPEGNTFVPYEVVLEELIKKNTTVNSVTFSDIEGKHNRADIENLADKCIVSGDENGNFYPDKNAGYAEYLSALLRTLNINPSEYYGCYKNVSANQWYSPYVQTAFDLKIISDADIDFESDISKYESAQLIYKALTYVSEKELTESENKLEYLVKEKIFTTDKNRKEAITRNEMAVCLNNVLTWCDKEKIDLTKFRQAPILLRASDAVKPGDIFNVYGEVITSENFEAVLENVGKTAVSEIPSESAEKLDAKYIDEAAQYASFLLPESAAAGTYALWIKNQYGWSKPVYINKARALWLSTEQATARNDVYVSGRNFDLSEIGGETNTHVKLSGDNGSFEAEILDINPFAVKFTVNETVPSGDYVVSVSNDGALYSESEDGVLLTVKDKVKDPYNIGVSWADEFNWDNVANVKDFGAEGDASKYDTAAIQAAIDSVTEEGGFVYLPEGTYIIESLKLPGYVVIAGDGMDKTTLLYRGDTENRTQSEINADVIVQSDYERRGIEGRQGILNITIDIDKSSDVKYQPKNYFWLGHGWNPLNASARTAKYIFVKNSRIGTRSFDWEKMEGVSGLGDKLRKAASLVAADKYLLVEGCEFLGDTASFTSTYMNRYIMFRNNTVNTFYGNVCCHCENTIYENNSITRCPWYIGKDVGISRQGIYSRNNSYVANNTINNTGCYQGDGEVIATESYNSGTRMYGNVEAAGASTLKLKPKTNKVGFVLDNKTWGNDGWDLSKRGYGTWNIVITDGRGVGQRRNIVSADRSTRTMKIDRPWDIIPDSTSKFTVYLPEDHISYYKNTVSDCSWAFLLYGGGYDNVIAYNEGYNMQGIDMCAILKESYEDNSGDNMDNRVWFHYFTRCAGNKFIGPSWKSKVVGITLNVKYEMGDLNSRYAYGIEIKNNYIEGDGTTGDDVVAHLDRLTKEGAKSVGYAAYNGIGMRFANNKKLPVDKKQGQAIIIQNNIMKNLDRGITFGGDRYSTDKDANYVNNYACSNTAGVILKGNEFENVAEPYIRYNDTNTVFLDGAEEDK